MQEFAGSVECQRNKAALRKKYGCAVHRLVAWAVHLAAHRLHRLAKSTVDNKLTLFYGFFILFVFAWIVDLFRPKIHPHLGKHIETQHQLQL